MIDPNVYIGKLIQTAPKMSAVEAHMVLIDHYETTFGIFDHSNGIIRKSRPMASVAMHDTEENGATSLLYETISKYHAADIATQFRMSLVEFMRLPREFMELMFTLAESKLRKVAAVDADLNQQFSKASGS